MNAEVIRGRPKKKWMGSMKDDMCKSEEIVYDWMMSMEEENMLHRSQVIGEGQDNDDN